MKYFAAFLTLLIACGVWLPDSNAEGPERPGRGGAKARKGDRRGPENRGARHEDRRKRFAKKRARLLRERIGLDEASAKKVEALFKQFGEQRQSARKSVRVGRDALNKLLRENSDDQAAYRAAIDKLRIAHDAMHSLRNTEWAALAKVLTPKQQATLLRALGKMQKRMGRRGRKGRRGKRGGRDRMDRRDGRGGPPRGGPPGRGRRPRGGSGGPPGADAPPFGGPDRPPGPGFDRPMLDE
ncbi:MAG: periplasmic heavy metal sensor [Polyangiaceae bacterium]